MTSSIHQGVEPAGHCKGFALLAASLYVRRQGLPCKLPASQTGVTQFPSHNRARLHMFSAYKGSISILTSFHAGKQQGLDVAVPVLHGWLFRALAMPMWRHVRQQHTQAGATRPWEQLTDVIDS